MNITVVIAASLLVALVPGTTFGGKPISVTGEKQPILTTQEKESHTSFALPASPTGSVTGEQIRWQVIASGGTKASSTNYRLGGTVGQTVVGSGTSTNYRLGHGFWQPFGGGGAGCCLLRGDIDHGGTGPDIADLVYLVTYMFGGGPKPPCEEPVGSGYYSEADIDGSGAGPDIADLVALVNYMFGGCPACLVPCP